MNIKEQTDTKGAAAWQTFIESEKLSEKQQQQFRRYLDLLLAWNQDINLTSIESIATIISHHFKDSLAVASAVQFTDKDMICDVGSGGGFPGIPLKIKYPFLKVILLEVQHKKILFLQAVIQALELTDIEVCDLDWRTFLRKTNYPITYFFARASLRPDELVRMFRPSSPYQQATLVYWASQHWVVEPEGEPFFSEKREYQVEHKRRLLGLFCKKGQ